MEQYIDLIKRIIKEGKEKKDRTGTGTVSIFGHQSTYDLSKGFPLLTAKHTYTRGVIIELLWFLGNHMKNEKYKHLSMTNIKYLVDNNVNIWNEWAHKAMLKYQHDVREKIILEEPNIQFAPLTQMPLEEFKDKMKNEKGFDEKWGDLGSIYGKQWKKWQFTEFVRNERGEGLQAKTGFVDQINWALHMLKTKPEDRGIVISAWNVGELDQMALRPCHTMFQFYTISLSMKERIDIYQNTKPADWVMIPEHNFFDSHNIPKYKLSLQLYQRSADVFLGVPFNVASYSILLHMFAQLSNMIVDKFVHTFGDAHIYSNHKTQVNELLKRISPDLKDNSEEINFWENKSLFDKIGNDWPELPELWLNPEIKKIEDFTLEDIKIKNYKPFSKIEAPIAV